MIVSQEKIKEFIKEQHAIDGMVSIHDFELWLEEQPRVGEWIPCSEMLPTVGELVLCTADDKISKAVYVFRMGEENKWCDFDGYEVDAAEITAWMPLPEPYKEKGASHEE